MAHALRLDALILRVPRTFLLLYRIYRGRLIDGRACQLVFHVAVQM